jgi:hypothetical protein
MPIAPVPMQSGRFQRVVTPQLTPCEGQAADAIDGQERVTSWPYYSRVKFIATRAGGGPYTYVMQLPNEGIRAFSYGLRQPRTSAGFTLADGNATPVDTNLTNAYETIGGQIVAVRGLALQWVPSGNQLNEGQQGGVPRERMLDYRFTAALNSVVSVEIGLNGDENTYKLGTIPMVPGAGGLFGGGEDISGLAALDAPKNNPYPNNGWPTRSNFFHVPEGLTWRQQGKADAQLNVIFRQQRPLTLYSGGSVENNPLGVNLAAGAASRGFNYPTELVAELQVFLVGQVFGPRTRVS